MSRPSRQIVFVGPLPPPVHGFSRMNQLVIDHLRNSGAVVTTINLAASSGHITRLAIMLRGLLQFLTIVLRRKRTILYIGVSGGVGQLGDMGFLLLARIFTDRIYLHHHSFAYIDRYSRFCAALVKIAGAGAVHITLCETMKTGLAKHYPSATVIEVISNAAFMDDVDYPVKSPAHGSAYSLLFLANISMEKGILEFIAIVEGVQAAFPEVTGLIAGPFADAAVESVVRDKLCQNDRLIYLGPVYGAEKAQFYARADVFVFPSKYRNEAEPLVVLEALAAGLPVVTTNRGCTANLIGADHGLLADPADVVGSAVQQITRWLENHELPALADNAVQQSRRLRQGGIAARDRLFTAMLG